MTVIRRDAWALSKTTTWPDALRWYAVAVRSMQARPISDPTSWAYQAAIHGLANTPPPPNAPWNECQHATWFFVPWHRMYLFHFESIVRAAVVAAGGPQDWALPYWNYEGPGTANQIPPAFRPSTLPDDSPNPLLVTARRTGINTGLGLPPSVTTSSEALATTFFTTPAGGAPVGFGGPRTGFAHFGPAPGALENQPHNIVHVAVGGNGLMSNPNTAALDPIFWLHHANIDRLWETWRLTMQANPQTKTWLRRTFSLRDVNGQRVKMAVRDVVDASTLGYTYDSLPAVAGGRKKKEETMAPRSRPRTVGRNARSMQVKPSGAATELTVGPLPSGGAATGRRRAPRFHLKITDIEGRANPGIVYGVYVNLPAGGDAATSERQRVGTLSFFGIEHSTRAGSATPQPLTYTFDATEVVEQARAHGDIDRLQVTLLPEEGMGEDAGEDAGAAAASTPRVTIGTVALLTS